MAYLDMGPLIYRKILEEPHDDNHRLKYADWLQENAGESECPRCNGEGFFGGQAKALFAAHPIEKVMLVDHEPFHSSGFHWYDETNAARTGLHPQSNLPSAVYRQLAGFMEEDLGYGMRVYGSEDLANQALSTVLVNIGRKRARLPSLQGVS